MSDCMNLFCGMGEELCASCAKDHKIEELEAKLYQAHLCLKGKCPVCKEDLESSCYGQSTNCFQCGFVLGEEGDDE